MPLVPLRLSGLHPCFVSSVQLTDSLWLVPLLGVQPSSAAPSDVRGLVGQALEEAKRIPEAPPLPPINYEELLRDIRQWIEDCQATQSDVQAAQQVRCREF